MNDSTTRIFTPSRIIALTLIAVVVAGLGYLRFGADPGSVSVPEGAKAGDLILESAARIRPRTAATTPITERSSFPRTAPIPSRA